jgi:hypothetical protein
MAWFTFKCPTHNEFKLSLDKRQKTAKCPTCGADSCGIIKLGSIQVLEHLDNGAMHRAVDRLSGIEEIAKERSDAHKTNQEPEEE